MYVPLARRHSNAAVRDSASPSLSYWAQSRILCNTDTARDCPPKDSCLSRFSTPTRSAASGTLGRAACSALPTDAPPPLSRPRCYSAAIRAQGRIACSTRPTALSTRIARAASPQPTLPVL